jgi:hypothetical protein
VSFGGNMRPRRWQHVFFTTRSKDALQSSCTRKIARGSGGSSAENIRRVTLNNLVLPSVTIRISINFNTQRISK